ncbi:MAG TPA: glycosyltransferase [Steroidobacteraceae bacterium]|nr:glycosyltransferase [Steroidobacteraceae bacterium]
MNPPTRKIRILFLIDYWGLPGGTERHLAYLLKNLDRDAFECRVVVFNYLPNVLVDEARASGIEVQPISVDQYYTPRAVRQAGVLRKYIRDHGIDIVQSFHFKSDVYGAVVARLSGVRHFVASKRDAADYKNGLHFFLHRLVRPITQHYIAVSKVVADVVARKEGVPAERMSIIYNGVDLERFAVPDAATRSAARAALGLTPEHFVIGMSAAFRPEKDHALLLQTFREFHRRQPATRLVLIGAGPLLEHYRKEVSESDLAGLVTFTGPMNDVRPPMHALDIAVLIPSMNEGFSNSIIEKMAMGLPLVVTRIGGNAEAVEDGATGFVIPPRDQTALLDAMAKLHDDAGLRSRLGAAARRRAEDSFSLSQMIRRHESLYRSLAPEFAEEKS